MDPWKKKQKNTEASRSGVVSVPVNQGGTPGASVQRVGVSQHHLQQPLPNTPLPTNQQIAI